MIDQENSDPCTALFTLLALVFGCLLWLFPRLTYRFTFANPASESNCFPRLKKWLPRLLGGGFMTGCGLAVLLASSKTTRDSELQVISAIVLLSAVALFGILVKRRAITQWIFGRRLGTESFADEARDLHKLQQLPLRTRLMLLVTAVFAGPGIGIWATRSPESLAELLGAPGVLVVAAIAILPTMEAAVYLGNRYRIPVLSVHGCPRHSRPCSRF